MGIWTASHVTESLGFRVDLCMLYFAEAMLIFSVMSDPFCATR